MDGKVPDDADIMLEQAEIDPHGIVVIHVAEPIFDDFAHLADGARMYERMIHGEDETPAGGLIDHAARFIHRRGHRLFDKDMLAGHHGFHRQFEMGRNRRCDGHRMNAWIAQHLFEVAGDFHGRIARFDGRQPLRHKIANIEKLCVGHFRYVSDKIWAPIAVANYRYADHYTLLDKGISAGAPCAQPII